MHRSDRFFLRTLVSFLVSDSEPDCGAIIYDYAAVIVDPQRRSCERPCGHLLLEHRVPRVHAPSGTLGSTRWTCHVCAVNSERSCGFPRREEEQRKKEDTTDFLRNCLDHQMDTLHKHSISRVLVRSRFVESGQKTTLFHKLVQSVFTEGSFRIMDTLLGFVLF